MKKYICANSFIHRFDLPEKRKTPEQIIRFLASVDKPIRYTHGHKGRPNKCNPYLQPISLLEAIDLVKKNSSKMYVVEYSDYVDLNTFDLNDVQYANSLSIWQ
jgi:hypothetical protein